MRTYAPAGHGVRPRPACSRSRRSPAASSTTRSSPAREASYGDIRPWLDPRIRAGLAARGIERLYIHQAEAIEAVRAGEDVVVVTPTASGKTLCYALPVLQAIAEDPAARALFLFPTKALGQDQVAEFGGAGPRGRPGGRRRRRTTATRRRRSARPSARPARSSSRNPDMLHSAILPHHTKWFQLFEQLRVIVIDELHTYRGVFGSHVANVLRRLLRLCAHYGSQPGHRLLLGDDRESRRARRDADRPAGPARSTATARRRASATSCSSTRRSSTRRPAPAARPLTLAQRWALPFLRAGRQTIVFGRSRVGGRDPAHGPARGAPRELGPRSRVRGYRGGYLPTERRAIERGLRDGEVLGVVAHERARARRRHRPARRRDPGGLPGLDRGDVAADRAGPVGGAGRQRRDPRRVAGAGRPVRHPPPGVPARRPPGGGAPRPGQPPRPARPPPRGRRSSCRSSRARCSGRRRRTTCSRSSPRRATSARPTTGAGTGARRTSRPRRSRCGRRRPENVVIIDTTPGPAARPRRGRPVLGPGPRPRARDLHPRVGPVPRRPARLGRAQGLRPPGRRRPLHVREPGGDAQAARRVRRGAGDRRPADPRRGDGREPRHALQEAQVRHRRERRLGPDRPAGDRAPDDRLLADRRGARRRAGGGTSSTSR